MSSRFRIAFVAAATIVAFAPAGAQQTPAAPRGVTGSTAPLAASLIKDLNGLGDKFMALAKAIPADKYDWRPGSDVRSVREVMLHVASDNYLLPALAGTAAPAATGIVLTDFKSVERYEKRALSRDSVVAELERSFTHLANAMAKTGAANLAEKVNMFGQQSPLQDLWILTTTHLHEHLGQSIAYARSNGVKPPWSR